METQLIISNIYALAKVVHGSLPVQLSITPKRDRWFIAFSVAATMVGPATKENGGLYSTVTDYKHDATTLNEALLHVLGDITAEAMRKILDEHTVSDVP